MLNDERSKSRAKNLLVLTMPCKEEFDEVKL